MEREQLQIIPELTGGASVECPECAVMGGAPRACKVCKDARWFTTTDWNWYTPPVKNAESLGCSPRVVKAMEKFSAIRPVWLRLDGHVDEALMAAWQIRIADDGLPLGPKVEAHLMAMADVYHDFTRGAWSADRLRAATVQAMHLHQIITAREYLERARSRAEAKALATSKVKEEAKVVNLASVRDVNAKDTAEWLRALADDMERGMVPALLVIGVDDAQELRHGDQGFVSLQYAATTRAKIILAGLASGADFRLSYSVARALNMVE